MYKAVGPEGLVTPTATIRVLTDGATADRVAVLIALAFAPGLLTILSSESGELRSYMGGVTEGGPTAACKDGIIASSRIFYIVFTSAVTTAPILSPPSVRFGTLSGPMGGLFATAPIGVVLVKLGPPFRSERCAVGGTAAPPTGTTVNIGGCDINTGTMVVATVGLTPLRVPVVPKSTDKFFGAT